MFKMTVNKAILYKYLTKKMISLSLLQWQDMYKDYKKLRWIKF